MNIEALVVGVFYAALKPFFSIATLEGKRLEFLPRKIIFRWKKCDNAALWSGLYAAPKTPEHTIPRGD
jgi:hypothetical protein